MELKFKEMSAESLHGRECSLNNKGFIMTGKNVILKINCEHNQHRII